MELPEGWVWAPLGDLCAPVDKVGREGFPMDQFQYIDISSVDVSTRQIATAKWTTADAAPGRARQIVQIGDIVYSTVRPYLHKIAQVPDNLDGHIASTGFATIRPISGVNRRYVYYAVQSHVFESQLFPKQRGVSYPAVRDADVFSTFIPLPPTAEQHRIVEAIETYLSRMETAEKLTRRSRTRAAHLSHAITAITYGYTIDRGQHAAPVPDPAGTEDGTMPILPSTWHWRRLGELAEVVGGVTKDMKKQSDPAIPEIPYLRVANVQRGNLDLSRVAHIRVPEAKAEQLALQHGDVLLNEGGDRDKLGRGWIWEGQIEGAIHQNHVFRARIRDGKLHPKLLSWHANSSGHWFEANGKQSVNLASISLSKIKLFPVPIPPPDEQAKIVERIEDQTSVLEKVDTLARQALSKSTVLRNALLRQAFTGKLVPQDPTDEPASELLARIQAERAAQPKAKRARRAPAQRTAEPEPKPAPVATTALPQTAIQQEFEL